MEPKQEIFLPYLKPLLDAPDSRYVLRDWQDKEQWQPQKYIDEDLLPPPEESERWDNKRSPILIIANLANQVIKASAANDSISRFTNSHIKSIDLAHAVRMQSAFQAYGPTRILLWVPDAEKRALVPRTVAYRGKVAVYLESAFHVEEVAGGAPLLTKARREDSLDMESSKLVAKRMEEDKVQIPPHRQLKPTDTASKSSTSRAWHVEMETLEKGFESLEYSQFIGKPPATLVHLKAKNPIRVTPEYDRLRILQRTLLLQNKTIDKVNTKLQKQEEIDRLDLVAHRADIDVAEQEHEFSVIDAKIEAFKVELSELSKKTQDRLLFLDDDRRASSLDPPLLMWDRRRTEPLIVHPNEFYSAKELALLDFQPLPLEKQFPLTPDQSIYFDMISTNLFGPRGATTLKHLNHSAPGAYEALVPHAPAVTDPMKGGRRDVESVRVRNLTPEMLWQLAKAWDEWLFKPSMSDTMTQFGVNYERDMTMRRGLMRH